MKFHTASLSPVPAPRLLELPEAKVRELLHDGYPILAFLGAFEGSEM